MKATNDEQLFFFRQLHLILTACIGERCIEPLVEGLDRLEDGWQDEIEQCPELWKVILEGGSSKNQAITGGVVLGKGGAELRLGILHAMTLVHNHVYPFDLAEHRAILDDIFIGRQQNLELAVPNSLLLWFASMGRPFIDE